MALDQVLVAAAQIDAQRIGYQAISLTEFASNLEPEIAAGSVVEVGGALYEAAGDEAITGWAGIAADSDVYIKLTVAGASVTASFTVVAPTWDTAKQGFYSGAERYVGGLYKDAAGDYEMKWLYSPLDNWECLSRGATRPIRRKVFEIGDWDMDATDNVGIAHGLASVNKIRTVSGVIRNDAGTGIIPIPFFSADSDHAELKLGSVNIVNVTIVRRVGGSLDGNVDYDDTPYNRGWVTVEYEA